tara:strand:- start:476 stop:712 length:237 start_codon:yes stop_codon:yes gene_type:complete
MDFEVGDVVCLKSGGADMTVEKIRDGEVDCVWLDSARRMKQRAFDVRLLEKTGENRGVIPLTIKINGLDPFAPDPTSD